MIWVYRVSYLAVLAFTLWFLAVPVRRKLRRMIHD